MLLFMDWATYVSCKTRRKPKCEQKATQDAVMYIYNCCFQPGAKSQAIRYRTGVIADTLDRTTTIKTNIRPCYWETDGLTD